jgi:peptidoglycan/xylan/chitin deacetylase (PgdA/CDA1 family)
MKRIRLFIFFVSCIVSVNIFAADNTVRIKPLPGTIALTFDDGPNPIYTPQILAILKKNNIKATFFMVGANAEKYPDIVKMVLADGHAVDSHSYSHPMLTKISDSQLQKEVLLPQSIIQKILGIKPVCLRYPFGASNEHVRNVIHEHGMMPVAMGFNSFDYERPGTDKIVNWVLKNIYSGQIILLHDGYDKREQTVAALPQIIDGVRQKGLGFSPICAN